jgi:NDP-sugar pyrophosphorylase family protein
MLMVHSKPSLLILAAGMGSRYGGLKQLDSFGPSGETIIDFSIYDAIQSGFTKLIFIIRESFSKEFILAIESRWKDKIEAHFVFQENHILPGEFKCPSNRIKPWGTGHAVWVAKDVINEPFGVINADDYYGKDAMNLLFSFLTTAHQYGVIAYELNNTLSDHGSVNRGICEVNPNGFLLKINERKNIQKSEYIYYELDGTQYPLHPSTLVSMNMWAMQKDYFKWAETYMTSFLKKELMNESSEFYIPDLMQYLIDENQEKIKVLRSTSNWIGVTYQEDKPSVRAAFENMIRGGLYPNRL